MSAVMVPRCPLGAQLRPHCSDMICRVHTFAPSGEFGHSVKGLVSEDELNSKKKKKKSEITAYHHMDIQAQKQLWLCLRM